MEKIDSLNNNSISLKERRSSNVNEDRFVSLLMKFSESLKSLNSKDQGKT